MYKAPAVWNSLLDTYQSFAKKNSEESKLENLNKCCAKLFQGLVVCQGPGDHCKCKHAHKENIEIIIIDPVSPIFRIHS